MRVWPVLAVVCLASCNNEPSFDERFETAEKSIRDKAADIDAELKEKQATARAKNPESDEAGKPD